MSEDMFSVLQRHMQYSTILPAYYYNHEVIDILSDALHDATISVMQQVKPEDFDSVSSESLKNLAHFHTWVSQSLVDHLLLGKYLSEAHRLVMFERVIGLADALYQRGNVLASTAVFSSIMHFSTSRLMDCYLKLDSFSDEAHKQFEFLKAKTEVLLSAKYSEEDCKNVHELYLSVDASVPYFPRLQSAAFQNRLRKDEKWELDYQSFSQYYFDALERIYEVKPRALFSLPKENIRESASLKAWEDSLGIVSRTLATNIEREKPRNTVSECVGSTGQKAQNNLRNFSARLFQLLSDSSGAPILLRIQGFEKVPFQLWVLHDLENLRPHFLENCLEAIKELEYKELDLFFDAMVQDEFNYLKSHALTVVHRCVEHLRDEAYRLAQLKQENIVGVDQALEDLRSQWVGQVKSLTLSRSDAFVNPLAQTKFRQVRNLPSLLVDLYNLAASHEVNEKQLQSAAKSVRVNLSDSEKKGIASVNAIMRRRRAGAPLPDDEKEYQRLNRDNPYHPGMAVPLTQRDHPLYGHLNVELKDPAMTPRC